MNKVLENEAYNDSKVKEKQRKEVAVKSKKERKSRRYICRRRGHAFWAYENRKKSFLVDAKQDSETTSKILEEEVKYL